MLATLCSPFVSPICYTVICFFFFRVHNKKVIWGNGFINNCSHNATTLISSEWNE